MATLQEKADLITLINEQANTPGVLAIVSLLNVYIQEVREKNDTDSRSNVLRNQGAISICQELKRTIREGFQIPKQRQVKTY